MKCASRRMSGETRLAAFVYILRCSDGHYYVGSTRGDSVERRVNEHNSGQIDGYTKSRLPVTLVYSEVFPNIVDAIAAERQLKGWSRKKKEALIAGDFVRLSALASRRKQNKS